LLEGEYGEKDVCVGVPVIVGRDGVEKIVEVKLNDAEKAKFAESTAAVREVNKALAGVL
jgi:malate dehydrogenase